MAVNGRHPMWGIALILLMAACFATLDTAVKYLGATLPVLLTVSYTHLRAHETTE